MSPLRYLPSRERGEMPPECLSRKRQAAVATATGLFEIVHHRAVAVWLEYLLHKLDVERMHLILILVLLALKLDIERDLVALVYHGTMAGCHASCVEAERSRDAAQVVLRSRQKLFGSSRFIGISPEDDDV